MGPPEYGSIQLKFFNINQWKIEVVLIVNWLLINIFYALKFFDVQKAALILKWKLSII